MNTASFTIYATGKMSIDLQNNTIILSFEGANAAWNLNDLQNISQDASALDYTLGCGCTGQFLKGNIIYSLKHFIKLFVIDSVLCE